MKIVIEKTLLEDALKSLIAFTDKKDMSNITSHVLIEAQGETLHLEANDLEMGLSLQITSAIEEEGSATLNAKHFLDIVSKLGPGELTLHTKEGEDFVHLSFKRSKFKLPLFDRAHFPPFPTPENLPSLHFSDTALSDQLKKLSNVINVNEPKYEFSGALLVFEERLELVATDTRRLSLVQIDPDHMPAKENPALEFILPKRALLEVVKLFSKGDFDMFYEKPNLADSASKSTMLFFKNESLLLYTRLISGKYPNYQQIIPQEFTHKVELKTQDFKDGVQIVHTLSPSIQIAFYPERVEFKSMQSESSLSATPHNFAETSMETSTPLDGFILHAHARYLLDALNALSTPTFDLLLNEKNMPFMIEKGGFRTLIMPIVVD
ncbi:DNA polymerase III subunit beta [Helicobacter bizzozeronii]|uniref:DNA polymerase III subunit beta n=1 Tax=Helicobacter bizzozeronii TaxID=56877 RepID=UPI0018F84DCB|nr:DNA polymerase III subunit beta [Helicobacter bizzozeronii]